MTRRQRIQMSVWLNELERIWRASSPPAIEASADRVTAGFPEPTRAKLASDGLWREQLRAGVRKATLEDVYRTLDIMIDRMREELRIPRDKDSAGT